MAEFLLELFSEEIPADLQKNLRESLLDHFKKFFIENYKLRRITTPNTTR